MASELQYYGRPEFDSGLTIVARVYNSLAAQVGIDVPCVEVGVLAIYIGNMPATGAGAYGVRFFNGSLLKAQGVINWDGAAEVVNATSAQVAGLPTLEVMEASAALTAVADVSALATTAQVLEIPAAVRSELAIELARIDVDVSSVAANNAGIADILADTNELQLNQGNWVTATGYATPADVTGAADALSLKIDTLPTLADMEASVPLTALADLSNVAARADAYVINEGVKKATLIIPHTDDLA